MADTKITALTAISTVDPAIDVLPIVDVSDTTMAASGTTKKITSNQILGAGGTATLASATITGDLTAGGNSTLGSASKSTNTNLNFSSDLGTQRIYLDRGGRSLVFLDVTSNIENYRIAGITGVHTWGVGGSTAMTLNSTGLGVGVVPGSAIGNLQVGGSANGNLYTQQGTDTVRMGMRATGRTGILFDSSDATYTNRAWYLDNFGSTGSLIIGRQGLDVVTFSNTGNVGVGVAPSAWGAATSVIDLAGSGNAGALSASGTLSIASNAFFNGSNWTYKRSASALLYQLISGQHSWFTAASGTLNTTITDFATAKMTLDASGNLLVGTVTSPSGAKVGAITKLSGVSLEGTASINVSTTPVVLSRVTGLSGLFFVQGYNTSGGAQGWWLVASTGGGTPTVIASGNSTGLTVTFTMVAGALNMNTASGTVAVNAFNITG